MVVSSCHGVSFFATEENDPVAQMLYRIDFRIINLEQGTIYRIGICKGTPWNLKC